MYVDGWKREMGLVMDFLGVKELLVALLIVLGGAAVLGGLNSFSLCLFVVAALAVAYVADHDSRSSKR